MIAAPCPRIVVLQLVTSSLKAREGLLLEVGAVALDRAYPHKIAESFTALVNVDPEEAITACDPYALELHTSNGLLDDLVEHFDEALRPDALTTDSELACWMDRVGATGSDFRTPLICFGTDWAEEWMYRFLPVTLDRFSKDRIDLGALLRVTNQRREKGDGRAASGALYCAEKFRALFGERT